MTPRHGKAFRLSLLELEARDVPAWFTVSAPDPAAGTLGSTDATHAGGLALNPDYEAVNGVVTVWADTPANAAAEAVRGTITVTIGGVSVDQVFGSDTVGVPADHKAFAVAVSGSMVSVVMEDLVGFAGVTPDFDYDDRTWGGVTVAPAAVPVVATGTWVWRMTQRPGDTATVEMTVTRPTADKFHWAYKATNDSLTTWFDSPGIHWFQLAVQDASLVTDMTTDQYGWTASRENNVLIWKVPCLADGPFVPMGASATFAFDTPPVPVVAATGAAAVAGVDGQGGGTAAASQVESGLLSGEEGSPPPEDPETPCAIKEENSAYGEAKGPGVALEAKLQSVTFTGAKLFTIAADPGDVAFAKPPHWLDQDLSGAIDQAGERTLPVGFVRGDQAKVSAVLRVTKGTAVDGFTFVRADGPGAYDLPWTKATVADGTITLPATALKAKLADKVDYIPDFKFKWEVMDFAFRYTVVRSAGDSTNEFFATLASPGQLPPGSFYVTPLWLFCSAAKDSANETDAISKAWTAFVGANVKTHASLDPMRIDPSVELHYYKEWNTRNTTAVDLLRDKDGQCHSWVELFRHDLLVGGVSKASFDTYMVQPLLAADAGGYLFIKNWKFGPNGTATPPGFTHLNEFVGGNTQQELYPDVQKVNGKWTYVWAGNPQVTDEPGKGGQNNTNPASLFNKHFVIRVGNTIYDPSYGTFAVGGSGDNAWETAQQMWESISLAGGSSYRSEGVDAQGRPLYKLAIYQSKPGVDNTSFVKV